MGVWEAIWYIQLKNGNNYKRKRGAPDGEYCVEKKSNTKGVGEVQNKKEDCQI